MLFLAQNICVIVCWLGFFSCSSQYRGCPPAPPPPHTHIYPPRSSQFHLFDGDKIKITTIMLKIK